MAAPSSRNFSVISGSSEMGTDEDKLQWVFSYTSYRDVGCLILQLGGCVRELILFASSNCFLFLEHAARLLWQWHLPLSKPSSVYTLYLVLQTVVKKFQANLAILRVRLPPPSLNLDKFLVVLQIWNFPQTNVRSFFLLSHLHHVTPLEFVLRKTFLLPSYLDLCWRVELVDSGGGE